MFVCVYVHACLFVYVHLRLFMYVLVCIIMCICPYMCVNMYGHVGIRVGMCMHMYALAHASLCVLLRSINQIKYL